MRRGFGRYRFGADRRWWLYFDTDHLAVGRSVTPSSVVYTVLGVVVEHYRPEGHADRVAEANRVRSLRKWQGVRNQMWRNTEWQIPAADGESLQQWQARRWRHTCLNYAARAADARALDEYVPTIGDLRVYAPAGVPADAYSN